MASGHEQFEELKQRAGRLEALLKEKLRAGGHAGLEVHEGISHETALLLQEMGDAIPTPLFIKDLDGEFTYCNLALAEVLQLPREHIVGRRVADFLPDDLARRMDRQHRALFDTRHVQVEECRLPRSDGVQVDVRIHRSLLKDRDGAAIGVVGVLQDLSEQRSAQREREISETRYRNLFINARDAIFVMDGERFVDCNPAAARMYGLSEEELVTKGPVELSPPFQPDGRDSAEAALEMIHSALAGKQQYFEWTHLRGDGSTFEAEVSLSPLFLDGEQLVLAIVRDITERKRTEAALEASEEFSRGMIQHAPIGVMYTDLDGTLIYENQVMERLMGVPRGQSSKALGRRLQDMPDLSEVPVEELLGRVAGGEAIRNLAIDYTSIYDQNLRLHVQIAPHTTPEGRVVGAIFMIQDVTELRRLQEQLHHAQKMDAIGNLAGGIAHDFNNLLTGISGNAEMALQHLDRPELTRAALLELIGISKRATQLTRRLLSFSRRQEQNPRPVLLSHLVEEMRRMLQRLIGEQVSFEFTPAGESWAVKVDPGQMEQVIVNLAVNSRDAMPGGGTIRLSLHNVELDEDEAAKLELEPGPHVLFRFSDNGEGIASEHLGQIFDPFFTTKEAGRGTGLGLSIVYGVIRQSAGAVRVTSTPGQGTTFLIYLPSLGAVRVSQPAPEAGRELKFARSGETILVIEDEDAVRELTVRCLEHCGYSVLSAATGMKALEIAAELPGPVDLVLSDVIMPGLSGPATVTRLKEMWPGLPVLFCSGYTDGELKKHNLSMEQGADLLSKPYSLEELSSRIRDLLDRSGKPGA